VFTRTYGWLEIHLLGADRRPASREGGGVSLDVSLIVVRPTEIYEDNITHNLGPMAAAAGIYECLWRPEEIGITKAAELIEPLSDGLERLKGEPAKYGALNPPNGWGSYEALVGFVERYLLACRESPEADVSVSR
jgi:hypothetical protein